MPKKSQFNAFYFYMKHYKEEQNKQGRNVTMQDAAKEAGPSWAEAPKHVKSKYEEMARKAKERTGNNIKYTTFGEPIRDVEEREREAIEMQKLEYEHIRKLVKKSFDEIVISSTFYVADVNYYCVVNGKYIICEFTLMRFNLERGIIDQYHEILNPGSIPVGYTSDAKLACDELGMELPDENNITNYMLILANVLEYLQLCNTYNSNCRVMPPLFTMPNKVAAVQSFIQQLVMGTEEDDHKFPVYHLDVLFFELVNHLVLKSDSAKGFPKESLALMQLQKDPFKYYRGLGCDLHEELDRSAVCTTSRCKRYCYMVLDHCCMVLDLQPIPGKHLPMELDIENILSCKNEQLRQEAAAEKLESIASRSTEEHNPWELQRPTKPTPSRSVPATTNTMPASSSMIHRPIAHRPHAAPALNENDFPVLGSSRGRGRRPDDDLASSFSNFNLKK